MPLYEYQCENCGERFEVMQKFSDTPLATHEKCGGKVERLLSAPALMFKGSGWYVNDYAKGSGSQSKQNNNEGGKGEGGKNEGSKSKDSDKSSSSATPATPAANSTPSKSSDTK